MRTINDAPREYDNYYNDHARVIVDLKEIRDWLHAKKAGIGHDAIFRACDKIQEAIMWLESDNA
jgi:hypothetical protein